MRNRFPQIVVLLMLKCVQPVVGQSQSRGVFVIPPVPSYRPTVSTAPAARPAVSVRSRPVVASRRAIPVAEVVDPAKPNQKKLVRKPVAKASVLKPAVGSIDKPREKTVSVQRKPEANSRVLAVAAKKPQAVAKQVKVVEGPRKALAKPGREVAKQSVRSKPKVSSPVVQAALGKKGGGVLALTAPKKLDPISRTRSENSVKPKEPAVPLAKVSEPVIPVIVHDTSEYVDITLPEFRPAARRKAGIPASPERKASTQESVPPPVQAPAVKPPTPHRKPAAPSPVIIQPEVELPFIPEQNQLAKVNEVATVEVMGSVGSAQRNVETVPDVELDTEPARGTGQLSILSSETAVLDEGRGCFIYSRRATVESGAWSFSADTLRVFLDAEKQNTERVEAEGNIAVSMKSGGEATARNASCEAATGTLRLEGSPSLVLNGATLTGAEPAARLYIEGGNGQCRSDGSFNFRAVSASDFH